jgi:hypothetical protein
LPGHTHLQPAQASARVTPKVLVVFLHGDNGGRTELKADSGAAAMLAEKLQAVTIAVQRPGYRSDLGTSDGQSGPGDDDYTPQNVASSLMRWPSCAASTPAKKSCWSATQAARPRRPCWPAASPAAPTPTCWPPAPATCPRGGSGAAIRPAKSGAWASLSPLAEAGKMPPATLLSLVVGNKDENTLPLFSESYARALQARGVKTRVTYAMNATHVSVLRSPEFFMLAGELADALSK